MAGGAEWVWLKGVGVWKPSAYETPYDVTILILSE